MKLSQRIKDIMANLIIAGIILTLMTVGVILSSKDQHRHHYHTDDHNFPCCPLHDKKLKDPGY